MPSAVVRSSVIAAASCGDGLGIGPQQGFRRVAQVVSAFGIGHGMLRSRGGCRVPQAARSVPHALADDLAELVESSDWLCVAVKIGLVGRTAQAGRAQRDRAGSAAPTGALQGPGSRSTGDTIASSGPGPWPIVPRPCATCGMWESKAS